MERKTYPSDISDDEWTFVAPYPTLMTEEAPQRAGVEKKGVEAIEHLYSINSRELHK